MKTAISKAKAPESTRERLLLAAAEEFSSNGYHGTDTNRIARRAGFAPQTFYRHFSDKTDAFIRVYERWQHEDLQRITSVIKEGVTSKVARLALAEELLKTHREWACFRRSLRWLSVEDERIRKARAESRRLQIAGLKKASGQRRNWESWVALLLIVERLCDAAADAEIDDLGVDPANWGEQIVRAFLR